MSTCEKILHGNLVIGDHGRGGWRALHMIGKRLVSLRESRKLDRPGLARKAGISLAVLTRYEDDEETPGSPHGLALAEALGVSFRSIYRRDKVTFRDFRRRGGGDLGRQEEAAIEVETTDRLQGHLDLMEVLGLAIEPWSPPRGAPFRIESLEDVDAAASATRSCWGLGDGPIVDLENVLERHGVIVIEHSFPVEAFVGTALTGTREVNVVGIRASKYALRRRFSMAHELGHLVTECGGDVDVEAATDRFAGSFLLPTAAVVDGMRQGTISEAEALRQSYGVSLQAIARRCVTLGLHDRAWERAIIGQGRATVAMPAWDRPTSTFQARCEQAHRAGAITWSRSRELLGTRPDHPDPDDR